MVDLRPLLFLNLLAVLMFLAAGVHYLASDDVSEVPEIVHSSTEPDALAAPEDAPAEASEASPESPEVEAADLMGLLAADTPEASSSAEPTTVTPPEEPTPAAVEPAASPAPVVNKPMVRPITEPVVVVKERTAPQVVAAESKPVTPAALPTGKLSIHSNVYEDTVLINGKPYGSTKLDVELTPGTYHIEVTKSGYHSWISKVEVLRGSEQTLKAQLSPNNVVTYKDGQWLNGVMTGEGSYVETGALEYTGSFVDGKFHGNGSARYANGLKYQGEWSKGKMSGRGTLTTPEGDTYVGEMSDDKFNGEGTLTKANGDIYTGFWINGALNGQGTLTTKGGMLYVGGFSENQFHGSGTLTYPDGSYYEGSFSNGLYHGKGTEVYANGKKYVGQFIEGLYHGKGELMNPNGSKIAGTFKNGVPFGQATLTTPEGEVFTARSSEPGVCYRLKSYRATECPKMEGW